MRRIERINKDATLVPFICDKCEENGIGVQIHPELAQNQYTILSIDSFYNAQKSGGTPPSADCLILQEYDNDEVCLFVIELKSQRSPRGIDTEHIRAKFETTLNDFVAKRFKDYFIAPPNKYRQIQCYLRDRMWNSLRLENMIEKPIIFEYVYIQKIYKRRILIERNVPTPLPKE